MKRVFITLIFITITQLSVNAQRLVKVAEGYAGTSVNTTVFRNNSIVTHQETQYIAYYDDDGYLVLGKRALNTNNWTLQRSIYQGNVKDAHNSISLMIDGDGYIHVSFDHHGHPLNYCRSIAPYSLILGDKEPMNDEDETHVTYPEFYLLQGGDLLFVYRSGSSGRGNLVMKRYVLSERKWETVQKILVDGENSRNAYWQLYVDAQGTIHLSWVWRETWMVETNHDLCYARSFDKGATWYKTTGEQYKLPITATNAEYACSIPQNSELINQTSMVDDGNGNPYIATYWRNADSAIPQYRLVWHDGKQWQYAKVGDRKTPFSLKGGGTKRIPIARPRLTVTSDSIFYFFRDEERNSLVSMASIDKSLKGNWNIVDLTDFPVDSWEPSYDTELWKRNHKLHLYVQRTSQGDGEKEEKSAPEMIYVLELDLNK